MVGGGTHDIVVLRNVELLIPKFSTLHLSGVLAFLILYFTFTHA